MALVAVAGLGSIALTWLWSRDPQPNTLHYEIARTLLQLTGIVVTGALLSTLTGTYQSARASERQESQRLNDERRHLQEASDEVLRGLIRETIASYREVKKARRVLQVRWDAAQDDPNRLDLATFDSQLGALNKAQLTFETLAYVASNLRDARVEAGRLEHKLAFIEHNLNAVWNEYQKRLRPAIASGKSIADGSYPVMRSLIATEDFKRLVSRPFHYVVDELQKTMLVPLPPPPVTRA